MIEFLAYPIVQGTRKSVLINRQLVEVVVPFDMPWLAVSQDGTITAFANKPVVWDHPKRHGEWDLGNGAEDWIEIGKITDIVVVNWKDALIYDDGEELKFGLHLVDPHDHVSNPELEALIKSTRTKLDWAINSVNTTQVEMDRAGKVKRRLQHRQLSLGNSRVREQAIKEMDRRILKFGRVQQKSLLDRNALSALYVQLREVKNGRSKRDHAYYLQQYMLLSGAQL